MYIVSSSPQGMTSWSSSIKFCFFYKLIECIIKKKMSWCETECKNMCHLVKQNVMKLEVFILGGQRIEIVEKEKRED